jgi:hypothetical protein
MTTLNKIFVPGCVFVAAVAALYWWPEIRPVGAGLVVAGALAGFGYYLFRVDLSLSTYCHVLHTHSCRR